MAKVLIIEPDQVLADQYVEYLSKEGHSVVVSRGAQSAILLADSQIPDIVVTELFIAKHSGLEFLYEFRSYQEWRDIPVIILSRVAQQEVGITEKHMKELGIAKFIYKHDSSMEKLAKIVNKFTRAKQVI